MFFINHRSLRIQSDFSKKARGAFKLSISLSVLVASCFVGTGTFVSRAQATDLLTTSQGFADQSFDRRVGIEVEFSGMSLNQALDIVLSFSGGVVQKKEKVIKTTLKSVGKDGMEFNEAVIPEWVIDSPVFGKLILKVDNNQITDDALVDSKDEVLELVTAPIRKAQVVKLQDLIKGLESAGARGTKDQLPVSIQINTEINNGDINTVDWKYVVNLMRTYFDKDHRKQIDQYLDIPQFRKDYLHVYSQGFLELLKDKNYQPTSRELFDDFFYRQSLELLGFKKAWTMPIEKARALLMAQSNPIVGSVVKQNALRVSSLLMMAFPNDPISRLYVNSGWALPMPIVEWREFNNDFDVIGHYKEVMGLMFMVEKYGAFDHDSLLSRLSGVEKKTIKELGKASSKQIEKGSDPVVFRYFLGDAKNVDKSEYKDMKKAYEGHPVGFLPFYEYGNTPVVIPGNSVVMHRNQLHRNSIVGKYNPLLTNGFIMQALENKYIDMIFWGEYASEGVPATYLLSKFSDKNISETTTPENIILVEVRNLLKNLDAHFKNGWVMKGIFDLGTEKDIITDQSDILKAVQVYLESDYDSYEIKINKKYEHIDSAPEYKLTELKEHKGYKGAKFLKLIENRAGVMVQDRMRIKREFRVEVVAGRVLGGESTIDRYKYMYAQNKKLGKFKEPSAEEVQKVESYAQYLVKTLPRELQNMSFGLDVALLEDGKVGLVESNPGGNSNFLYEEEDGSVKILTQFLLKYPKLVENGKIPKGLSAEAQMNFLKEKFVKWNINVAEQYPGMTFTKNEIVDPEYKKIPENKSAFTKIDSKGNQCHILLLKK